MYSCSYALLLAGWADWAKFCKMIRCIKPIKNLLQEAF